MVIFSWFYLELDIKTKSMVSFKYTEFGVFILDMGGILQLRGRNYTKFWPPTSLEWAKIYILHNIYPLSLDPHPSFSNSCWMTPTHLFGSYFFMLLPKFSFFIIFRRKRVLDACTFRIAKCWVGTLGRQTSHSSQVWNSIFYY